MYIQGAANVSTAIRTSKKRLQGADKEDDRAKPRTTAADLRANWQNLCHGHVFFALLAKPQSLQAAGSGSDWVSSRSIFPREVCRSEKLKKLVKASFDTAGYM